ncbi:hypothetical protein [Ammoniphilus sp. 3BR4]|uniref:hypothetical protein n=1 Tax=Ammoniphilus sp. 3BR4 TaxID=3158265 RepID=UPI00346627F5
MEDGSDKLKKIKGSLFWRTYLLNLFLTLAVLMIISLSAASLLPEISREQSKELTDQAADRVSQQMSVLMGKLRYTAETMQYNETLLSDAEGELLQELGETIHSSLVIDLATIMDNQGRVITAYPSSFSNLKGKNFGHETKIPILSSDVQSYEVLTISTDITEQKQREKQMERLAFYDTLTGLPNRRIHSLPRQSLARLISAQTPLGLAFPGIRKIYGNLK